MSDSVHHTNSFLNEKINCTIQNQSWQASTIEDQNNASDYVCITISPSQFRSLLSSNSKAIEFAHQILVYVRQNIRSSHVLILIADYIQKYNVIVFEHKNEQCAIKLANSLGQKILGFYSKALDKLPLNADQEIEIICWTDMLLSSNYDIRVAEIRQFIDNDGQHCHGLIDDVRKLFSIKKYNNHSLQSKKIQK